MDIPPVLESNGGNSPYYFIISFSLSFIGDITMQKAKKQKKPSKTLVKKINAFNRLNEATNKKINAERNKVIKQAKKEGFQVNIR